MQECLLELGFVPSLSEIPIYMRKFPIDGSNHYKYIATYVDDLAVIMKDQQSLIGQSTDEPYNFKLKGSGPLNFHLGCFLSRDNDGTLYLDPEKFIVQMIEAYEQHFGVKPKMKHRSPLQKGDHPELDTTLFFNEDEK